MTTTATAHFDKIRVYLFGLNKQTINNLTEHWWSSPHDECSIARPRDLFFFWFFSYSFCSAQFGWAKFARLNYYLQFNEKSFWFINHVFASSRNAKTSSNRQTHQAQTAERKDGEKKTLMRNCDERTFIEQVATTTIDDDDTRRNISPILIRRVRFTQRKTIK